MKKLVTIVILVAVIVVAGVFASKLLHTCDDCGKFFVGAGYEPNIIEDVLSEEEQIICKECAEDQHSLSTLVGHSLDEYKRDIF